MLADSVGLIAFTLINRDQRRRRTAGDDDPPLDFEQVCRRARVLAAEVRLS